MSEQSNETEPGADAVADAPVEPNVAEAQVDVRPGFEELIGEVGGELGTVEAAGTLYDVAASGRVGAFKLFTRDGTVLLAEGSGGFGADGVGARVELTSAVDDRNLVAGDVITAEGEGEGKIKVTIQGAPPV